MDHTPKKGRSPTARLFTVHKTLVLKALQQRPVAQPVACWWTSPAACSCLASAGGRATEAAAEPGELLGRRARSRPDNQRFGYTCSKSAGSRGWKQGAAAYAAYFAPTWLILKNLVTG